MKILWLVQLPASCAIRMKNIKIVDDKIMLCCESAESSRSLQEESVYWPNMKAAEQLITQNAEVDRFFTKWNEF